MLHEAHCNSVALSIENKVSGVWLGLPDTAAADQQVAKYNNEDCSFI